MMTSKPWRAGLQVCTVDTAGACGFHHQLLGHCFEDGAKAGVAKERSTGYILKVVDGDERGQRELEFYETLFQSNEPNLIKLRRFVSFTSVY